MDRAGFLIFRWPGRFSPLGPQWRVRDPRMGWATAAALTTLILIQLPALPTLMMVDTSDFFAFWSFAKFVQTHLPTQIYDQASVHAFQIGLGWDANKYLPFLYPPGVLLLLCPFAPFSLAAAFALWVGITLTAYAVSMLSRGGWALTTLAVLAAPSTLICVRLGQMRLPDRCATDRRTAACTTSSAVGWRDAGPRIREAAVRAVAATGSCVGRAVANFFVAAAATVLAIVALSSIVFAWTIWLNWAEALPQISATFQAMSDRLWWKMPTVTANLGLLGMDWRIALAGQVVAGALAAWAVWYAFRRGSGRSATASLLAASFLATPYAQLADLPLVTSAAILLAQERACADGVLRTGQIAVLVLAFLLPYMLMASFPVGPAVIGLLLAGAVASRPGERVARNAD